MPRECGKAAREPAHRRVEQDDCPVAGNRRHGVPSQGLHEQKPASREPAAVANTAVLDRLGTIWERAACSIGKNGPTSWPLGLITPIVPASVVCQKSCNVVSDGG